MDYNQLFQEELDKIKKENDIQQGDNIKDIRKKIENLQEKIELTDKKIQVLDDYNNYLDRLDEIEEANEEN